MQLDRINAGIVPYGSKPMPAGGQFQDVQPLTPPARSVRQASGRHLNWKETSNIIIISAFSATTATIILGEPCLPAATIGPQEFLLDGSAVVTAQIDYSAPRIEPAQSEPQVLTNPVLEMRSARRSLRDKAREEMSDFEREYPW